MSATRSKKGAQQSANVPTTTAPTCAWHSYGRGCTGRANPPPRERERRYVQDFVPTFAVLLLLLSLISLGLGVRAEHAEIARKVDPQSAHARGTSV